MISIEKVKKPPSGNFSAHGLFSFPAKCTTANNTRKLEQREPDRNAMYDLMDMVTTCVLLMEYWYRTVDYDV